MISHASGSDNAQRVAVRAQWRTLQLISAHILPLSRGIKLASHGRNYRAKKSPADSRAGL
jgi:hypothetical protein